MTLYEEDIIQITEDQELRKFLSGKIVAITGASGMIGTVLVDALIAMNKEYGTGIRVLAMGRRMSRLKNRFDRFAGDVSLKLLEQDVAEEFDPGDMIPDLVIHAASNTHPHEYSGDPIGTIMTNVMGTKNILEWMREHMSSRFILISSVEIYGANRYEVKAFSEKDCGYIDCNSLRAGYPESKRLSETMVQAYIADAGIDSVIIRLCRVYGPTLEPDDSKALSQFIHKGCAGENIVLKSAGEQLFSYLHVVDAVRAVLAVARSGKTGEAYNAASPDSDIRLKELAALIASYSGTEVVFDLPDEMERKGYSTADMAVLDASKLKALGWNALYSIEEGIRRTMEIIKQTD